MDNGASTTEYTSYTQQDINDSLKNHLNMIFGRSDSNLATNIASQKFPDIEPIFPGPGVRIRSLGW